MIKTFVHKTKDYGAAYLFAGPLMFRVQEFKGTIKFYIQFKFVIRRYESWALELPSRKFSYYNFNKPWK